MDFSHSDKVRLLQEQVAAFMDAHIYPAEPHFDAELERNRRDGNPWQPTAIMEELKRNAPYEQAISGPGQSPHPSSAMSSSKKMHRYGSTSYCVRTSTR